MLSPEELQARIAAEFLRVGASQQSWDQNFPDQPSVWVPGSGGTPVLSDESRAAYREIAGAFAPPEIGTATPPPNLNCPPPSVQTYLGMSWVCMMPDGSLVVSQEDDAVWTPELTVVSRPTSVIRQPATSGGALPQFIGGRLGRVLFPQIANRQLTGVRVGTLPQVVFGDHAPDSYGGPLGMSALGGAGSENVEP